MEKDRTLLFLVGDQAAGVRLDQLIPRLVPDLSRSRVQKMIGIGLVTVNERPAAKRYLARAKDRLRITLPPPESSVHLPEDIPLSIIYEDEDLAAVDKPSGMVVHPAPGHPGGTLVNALLHRGQSLSHAGGEGRPGIVHRLDKDTSGLVVFALSGPAARGFSKLFAERSVEKRYLAVVSGKTPDGLLEMDEPVTDERKGRSFEARTLAKRLRYARGAGLLLLRPLTGRRHQLRVHLAGAGHPILGDPRYGPAKGAGYGGRLLLHAAHLAFLHPVSGEPLVLFAPPPADFAGPCQDFGFFPGEPGPAEWKRLVRDVEI